MKNRLVFLLMLSLFICLNFAPATGKESREFEKTFSLNKDGRVTVDTYKGSITVETWSKEMVRVKVKIESDDDWDSYAEEKVKNTEIIFRSSKNTLKIETDYDNIRSRSSGFFKRNVGSLPLVHYSITMPATARLNIDDYKSDTKIMDLYAPIDMETYKGTVIVKNLSGSIDLETYKGDVEVDFSDLSGDCRFETYKGNIEIAIPDNASFDITADVSYKADFDSDFDIDVNYMGRKKRDRTYRGRINRGGASLDIETEKGDIRLFKK